MLSGNGLEYDAKMGGACRRVGYDVRTWVCILDDEPPTAAEEVDDEAGFVLKTLKTTPGLSMPMEDEWDRRASQSVFEVDEEEDLLWSLSLELDMVKLDSEKLV